MSKLYRNMEWHDSTLSAVDSENGTLVVRLRPAYVHQWKASRGKWIGEGFVQDLDATVPNGKVVGSLSNTGIRISDGELWVSGQTCNELLPLPYRVNEMVELKLVLVSGEELAVRGTGLSLSVVGAPRFVESLPEEFAPKESPA